MMLQPRLAALADEIEKIAEGSPIMRTAMGGALAGGLIGAWNGVRQPIQQDPQGNLYQPTISDRFAAGAKGLYRGGLVGGLLGGAAGAATKG